MARNNAGLISLKRVAFCSNPACDWSLVNPPRFGKPKRCPRCKSTVTYPQQAKRKR